MSESFPPPGPPAGSRAGPDRTAAHLGATSAAARTAPGDASAQPGAARAGGRRGPAAGRCGRDRCRSSWATTTLRRRRAAPTTQADTDLGGVATYDDLTREHTTRAVEYPQSPPVGGDHFGAWADCGVYDAPLPDELAVHDLEHGAFWFSYDPGALDAPAVAALAAELPENGIMAPYDGLDAPVVATVWGRQLALTGPDDPRLPLFLDAFAGGDTAPEPFASCAGGLSGADLQRAADALSGTGSA